MTTHLLHRMSRLVIGDRRGNNQLLLSKCLNKCTYNLTYNELNLTFQFLSFQNLYKKVLAVKRTIGFGDVSYG